LSDEAAHHQGGAHDNPAVINSNDLISENNVDVKIGDHTTSTNGKKPLNGASEIKIEDQAVDEAAAADHDDHEHVITF
jgi:hypothetical protein